MKLRLKLGRHILVLGPNDSGKTNAMLYLWTRVPRDVTAIWVDLEEDYDNIGRLSDTTVTEMAQLLDALSEGRTRIHFLEPTGNRETQVQTWDQLCHIANELGNIMLFCDEIMAVCTLFDITPEHYKSLTRGRKRQVSLVCASQRTQAINKTLVTESHTRICFRLSDYDTTALRQWFPEAHWLKRAEPYSFLLVTPGEGSITSAVCKPLPLVLPAKPTVRAFNIDLSRAKGIGPIEELKRRRNETRGRKVRFDASQAARRRQTR